MIARRREAVCRWSTAVVGHAQRRRPRERGIALVAVLWIITSLTVLVLSFNSSVRSHLDLTATELGQAHSRAAIDAALRLAVHRLRATKPADRWLADGEARNVNVVGRAVRITIRDEHGLIDLNKASVDLLRGMMERHLSDPSRARVLAARIADWRDEDGDVREAGAEDAAYIAAGRAGGAGNRPFFDAMELSAVLGVSRADAVAIAPFVTVHSGRASINILAAPKGVLEALPGINAGMVNAIVRLRQDPQTDPKVLQETLQNWKGMISVKEGRSFRVQINVTDPVIVPLAVEVTVLLMPRSKHAFHVLNWQERWPQPR